MKRLLIAILALITVFAFTACGSDNMTDKDNGAPKENQTEEADTASRPDFNFSNIEWEVKNALVDGDRRAVFCYTNNSEFDIVELDLRMKMKEDVTEDEIASHEQLKEKSEAMDHELKYLTIDVITNKYVKPGETAENLSIGLDGTVEIFTGYEAYDLFEPDSMTIYYVANNTIYSATYDYVNEETIYNSTAKQAFTWSDSELAKKLPKPDSPVVTVDWDDEDHFSASIFASDHDAFVKYAEACKAAGFDADIDDELDWWWTAKDKDGCELSLQFMEEDGYISLGLNGPKDE